MGVHLGINERQLKAATRAAIGLKMATGMGEQDAMRTIALAVQTGEIRSELKERIPALKGIRDRDKAFEKLIEVSEQGFKRIEQEGTTGSRKMADAGSRWSDALAESMKPAAKVMNSFWDLFKDSEKSMSLVTDGLGLAAAGIGSVVFGLGALTTALSYAYNKIMDLAVGKEAREAGLGFWDKLAHKLFNPTWLAASSLSTEELASSGFETWDDRVKRKQAENIKIQETEIQNEALKLGKLASKNRSRLLGGFEIWQSIAASGTEYSARDQKKSDDERNKILERIEKEIGKKQGNEAKEKNPWTGA